MTKYTVSKGDHAFKVAGLPPAPSIRKDLDVIQWAVKFGEDCIYSFDGVDQRDWNKGGGVSFFSNAGGLLTNHTDSAMFGWRYNPMSGRIELTAYCHVAGKRPILPRTRYAQKYGLDREVCLEVEIGMTAIIALYVNREARQYDFGFKVNGSLNVWPESVPFTHAKRWTRVIHPWFGGDNAAPHKMSLYLERK